MSDELKPCPFCGEPAVVAHHDSLGYIVSCTNDGDDCAAGRVYLTAAAAADAWNTRAAQPAEPTALKRREAWLVVNDGVVVEMLRTYNTATGVTEWGVVLEADGAGFAPTLAAAIEQALKQAEEGKP